MSMWCDEATDADIPADIRTGAPRGAARFGVTSACWCVGGRRPRRVRSLAAGAARATPRLRPEEQDVYLRLVDVDHRGHRRIERRGFP